MTVEAEKSDDLPSVSWRPRRFRVSSFSPNQRAGYHRKGRQQYIPKQSQGPGEKTDVSTQAANKFSLPPTFGSIVLQ